MRRTPSVATHLRHRPPQPEEVEENTTQSTTCSTKDITCKRCRSCFEFADLADEEKKELLEGVSLSPSNLYLTGRCCDAVSSASSEEDEERSMLRLWLPQKGSRAKLDVFLSRIPRIVSRAEEILSEGEVPVASDNKSSGEGLSCPLHLAEEDRCLNVLQGEVAHISAEKADFVVSAEATTCHVVALRSTTTPWTGGDSKAPAFVSLAHIDQSYDACLENMVQEHIAHHDEYYQAQRRDELDQTVGFFMEDDEDFLRVGPPPTKASRRTPSFIPDLVFDDEEFLGATDRNGLSPPPPPVPIDMELHVAGGYLDEEGLSQQLSTQIIERFDELAHKYRDLINITLSTAVISSLNNDNDCLTTSKSKPKSRGLGIDTRTGHVFAVKTSLPARLQGPALEIRSARAFSGQSMPTLSVIHDRSCHKGEIRINPFKYKQRQDLNVLLQVPDEVLLSVASTSPENESSDFCGNFRRTLSFVNTVPPETVFGGNKPLVYRRSTSNLNEWEQKHDEFESDTPMF